MSGRKGGDFGVYFSKDAMEKMMFKAITQIAENFYEKFILRNKRVNRSFLRREYGITDEVIDCLPKSTMPGEVHSKYLLGHALDAIEESLDYGDDSPGDYTQVKEDAQLHKELMADLENIN